MRKMRKYLFIIITPLVGVWVSGCSGCFGPVLHTASLERPPKTAAERNFQTVWRASRGVLKKYYFPLDRQDRRAGIITTDAVTGGHLFELWRKDAATAFHYRENTVQTIYRAAKVTIRRVKGADKFDVDVEIAMARSDAKAPQLTTSSQVGHLSAIRKHSVLKFNDLIREPDLTTKPADALRYRRKPEQTTKEAEALRYRLPKLPECTVVPLGRDTDLEMHVLQKIRDRAGDAIEYDYEEAETPTSSR